MTKRRPYQPRYSSLNPARLRKEWVSLTDGDVCVWEMTTLERLALAERAGRPAIDPRGGVSETAATTWLIALSVHHDDEPDSPRVWDDLHADDALQIPWADVQKIIDASKRVSSLGEEEVAKLEDFTKATGAPSPSGSTSSVPKNSTGSPARSMLPTTS